MDESDKNLYEILNVDKNSTVEEIRKQYRLQALKHHPDKYGGDVVKFTNITNAYEILSNLEKRNEYDNKRVFKNQIHSEFNHVFQEDVDQQKITIYMSLNEILYGCYKIYNVNMTIPCRNCKSTGISNPDKNAIQCRECFGKGTNPMMSFLSCMTCNGKGIFILQNTPCKICNGETKLKQQEERTIYLKPGIGHNEIITLSNVLILLIEHEYDTNIICIDGMDLYLYINITLMELLCGFTKEIPLGQESHTIQSKKTFDYQQPLKVRNKGIAENGDLYVVFKLTIDVSNKIYEKIGNSLNALSNTKLEFKLSDEDNVINVCDN
jgi:DnaJ-class molecular chaperone